ncbi:MAG: UDP-phosphate N-acetylglucosaminyl 1-phosphate transferase [Polyangiaceae bacterium]|nr:UDP-phosphate N-acetylglucosaminyl 1-phosphate transferase [Polyangiaceae bacterium]
MDVRLRAFGEAGGEEVDLPHGTEIVTRVDKLVGERRLAHGTIGRVTKMEGDAVDVTIVGVGVVRYRRSELAARRVGQMSFARRRHAAWGALSPCIVLESAVGSRAWGLSHEGSDHDRRGVFALPFSWCSGLVAPPEDLVSADGSATYWSASKCIAQALRADPNTLETLFVPSAQAIDPIGEWLLAERDAFVSIEIYGTFGRYALAQLRRLEQGARLHEHRSLVLTWARDEPSLTLDVAADRLADRTPRLFPSRDEAVNQAKQWLKQLYRSLADQGLVGASDWASLVAFAKGGANDLDLPRELRPKNAYNLLRLLWTATEWLRSGEPTFEVSGAFRDRLWQIKRGEVALVEVLEEAERMMPALDAARDASPLRKRPELSRVNALHRRIAEEIARRHVERDPGSWGKDAPTPPDAEWAE